MANCRTYEELDNKYGADFENKIVAFNLMLTSNIPAVVAVAKRYMELTHESNEFMRQLERVDEVQREAMEMEEVE